MRVGTRNRIEQRPFTPASSIQEANERLAWAADQIEQLRLAVNTACGSTARDVVEPYADRIVAKLRGEF